MLDSDWLVVAGAGVGVVLFLWVAKTAYQALAQSRLRRQMTQQSHFEAAAFADQVHADHVQVKAAAVKLVRSIRELGNLTGPAGSDKRLKLEQGVFERLKSADKLMAPALASMQADALADASMQLRGIRTTLERQGVQIQAQCARIREKDGQPSSGAMASLR